jgi:hypothetical protein
MCVIAVGLVINTALLYMNSTPGCTGTCMQGRQPCDCPRGKKNDE